MATPPPRVWVLLRHLLWIIYIYLYINLNPNLNLNSKLCVARSMNQTNCYRNRKSISNFVNVCKKLMPKILNDLQNKPVKILKKKNTKKQTKPHAQNPTYIYYIYIISIYYYWCIFMLGPHHCVCCRPFHFFVCVRLGALCVSLSLVPQQHHTTCTTNKCYNKIISKKIYIKRGAQSTIIYVFIYILCIYVCIYASIYVVYIVHAPNWTPDRPPDCPPARLNWPIRPPARLARSKNQPNKTNNV